ncbi:MAG: hypothetical protein ACI8Z5_001173 [Lentimonas sp.]|jgi:hypothetical protein
MKRSKVFFYLVVWCASIALSFSIGRSLSSTSTQSEPNTLGSAQLKEQAMQIATGQTEAASTLTEGEEAHALFDECQLGHFTAKALALCQTGDTGHFTKCPVR